MNMKFLYHTICYEYDPITGYTGDSDLFYKDTVITVNEVIGAQTTFYMNGKQFIVSSDVLVETDEVYVPQDSLTKKLYDAYEKRMNNVKDYRKAVKDIYGIDLKDGETADIDPKMFNGVFKK